MRSEEHDWTTVEFGTSHRGRPGAVLPDGSEPKPVVFDVESGTNFRETRNWQVYAGSTLSAPRATALRGACSCGWRGSGLHPIDWS